jgi:serpin B
MKRMMLWGSLILTIFIFISGCTGPSVQTGTETPLPTSQATPAVTSPVPGAEGSVVEANNRFAFDLYDILRKEPSSQGGNIFFSPFSISSALAITYEGARGETADEIRFVFHFPQDDSARRQGFREIYARINQPDGYVLSTANALWAENTYHFLAGFIAEARKDYSANATGLDFAGMPEASRMVINQWVADRTNQKIQDLLPEGSVSSLTRLVITNAVYFKGTWLKQFEKNRTRGEDFRVSPGETVQVQMMESTDRDSEFGYNETGSLQVLEMPYERGNGSALSMLVILPKGDDLAGIEDTLDLQRLSDITGSLVYRRVNVYFPRFTFRTRYSLSGTLKTMGIHAAFDPDLADLSGMDGSRNLSISEIFHQAFVDVNEEGTEAAAATGVVVGLATAVNEGPVPEFRADHPFIFLIRDEKDGNILFIGRVTNPNG